MKIIKNKIILRIYKILLRNLSKMNKIIQIKLNNYRIKI